MKIVPLMAMTAQKIFSKMLLAFEIKSKVRIVVNSSLMAKSLLFEEMPIGWVAILGADFLSLAKFLDAGIQDVSTSISIVHDLIERSRDGDESDKHI